MRRELSSSCFGFAHVCRIFRTTSESWCSYFNSDVRRQEFDCFSVHCVTTFLSPKVFLFAIGRSCTQMRQIVRTLRFFSFSLCSLTTVTSFWTFDRTHRFAQLQFSSFCLSYYTSFLCRWERQDFSVSYADWNYIFWSNDCFFTNNGTDLFQCSLRTCAYI